MICVVAFVVGGLAAMASLVTVSSSLGCACAGVVLVRFFFPFFPFFPATPCVSPRSTVPGWQGRTRTLGPVKMVLYSRYWVPRGSHFALV